MSDEMMEAFNDEDKVVIIGGDLNNEFKAGFMVDKFDRQLDQLIIITKFQNLWGIEDVTQQTFLNARL